MTREERIEGLMKIAEFFKARADMAVGDAKMLLLNWMKCAEEAAELIAAHKAEGERVTTSSVSGEAADTFPRGEGEGEAQGAVVRCRECRYWRQEVSPTEHWVCAHHSFNERKMYTTPDFYCSDGERRDGA